jgi:hypothetical protein
MTYTQRSKPLKVKTIGRFIYSFDTEAQDCKLVVLLGWGNYRFRADFSRDEVKDGWKRTVTHVKAWRIESSYSYQITKYYFNKIFVH